MTKLYFVDENKSILVQLMWPSENKDIFIIRNNSEFNISYNDPGFPKTDPYQLDKV